MDTSVAGRVATRLRLRNARAEQRNARDTLFERYVDGMHPAIRRGRPSFVRHISGFLDDYRDLRPGRPVLRNDVIRVLVNELRLRYIRAQVENNADEYYNFNVPPEVLHEEPGPDEPSSSWFATLWNTALRNNRTRFANRVCTMRTYRASPSEVYLEPLDGD
ncbi:hypothetical protein NMY22_g19478 [Coprinellus aureogranulatus]|nr:hypothetical protein NMY22_g19478 [Coprinellus aureogranulatus]